MRAQEYIKPVLQKVISPFVSNIKPQKRYAIVHDLLSSQMQGFRKWLGLIDRMPSTDVTLTFDDGFHSSYQTIKQLHDRKAIFFVCPAFINSAGNNKQWQIFFHKNLLRSENLANAEFREAVRPASWDDLKELVKLGHTIGSHTMTHARLAKIILQKELEREIIGSADMIEDRLQIKVDTFAYPFGTADSIDERAYRIIKKRYTRCFTGVRGNNAYLKSPFAIWRDAIDLSWPLEYIQFVLRGGLDWRYILKRRHLQRLAV